MATNRSNERSDQANRVRQAAMRADAFRSILPLCTVDEAVQTITERRLIERRQLPRGAAGQLTTSKEG